MSAADCTTSGLEREYKRSCSCVLPGRASENTLYDITVDCHCMTQAYQSEEAELTYIDEYALLILRSYLDSYTDRLPDALDPDRALDK